MKHVFILVFFVFIGNAPIKNLLEQAIDIGKFASVCCLAGVDQIGKRTLAMHLAGKLLNVPATQVVNHPDFYYVNRAIDEKTDKVKKEISVGQIRLLRSFLQNQSWISSGIKVIIIDEAEFLNIESSNALLKSLEEPTGRTYFFLLVQHVDCLLSTIHSRAQIWNLNPVNDDLIRDGLLSVGCAAEQAQKITRLSWGRPGRALNFYYDPVNLSVCEERILLWKKLRAAPLYERLNLLGALVAEKDIADAATVVLPAILEIWMSEERYQLLRVATGKAALADRSLSLRLLNTLREARSLLVHNINARLVMEKILLQF